jgi:ABC-2 type transport system permease protein
MEILRTLRAPAFLGYTIGFPSVFYLLFTKVFGQASASKAGYVMVSMALYGAIVAALPGFGARIALERTKGWTRQLALSPMRPGTYLVIKLVAASLLTVPALLGVMVLGRLVNHVTPPAACGYRSACSRTGWPGSRRPAGTTGSRRPPGSARRRRGYGY